ncbi:HAUS augmin-like complex subunit 6 [Octodon degus]|uniref:HAUS augmin-like complex subunit 6 n=1 Tax=Octodon degus TaxID=10160 RepID=A0A6P6EH16_OCTDE|nr:HAUS augmin-like complex subunit 6 [Octodon degus]
MSAGGLASFEKQHLWMYLRALGFEPGPAAAASGKLASHAHLGVNMFDKLNRDAFHIVSYFLFQTLDQSLTKEVFKFCWPPYDQKSDAEFRKHCCEWLKKISAECEGGFPQVVGSLFLSPGGPKFIHLMYHFARFVAVKYIKANCKNSSLQFTEMFNVKTQDMHKSLARCHIARNRFLQVLQRKDYVIQKYEENAQLSLKQVRNLRSEYMGLQSQVKKMEPSDDQSHIKEKIEKVRSLWTQVNETLTVLEEEREVINSILNVVNQYDLDGSNVSINIPSLLLDKIEKQICQLHIGNVYEAGKLNLLTVIQLLNEVLKIMKYERCQSNQASFTIDRHYLEKETRFQRERLSRLKQMRCKIKEDLITVGHSVIEKQGEWDRKWEALLGVSPFSLFKGHTPAVDLLPPMCPLSFDPVSEEVYAKSILSQYPASLPEIPKQHNQENDCRKHIDTLAAVCDIANSSASFLLRSASSSERNSVALLGKDTVMRAPKEKGEIISKKIPELEGQNSVLWDAAEDAENRMSGGSLPAEKRDPFQKEQDLLVEEVARAVLSNSPQVSEGKEVKLEELIDSIVSNPFLTRKQIPRTPENLITEGRSSWRQAVEMEDTGSTEPIQMDTHRGEVLPESLPVLHSQREFSVASLFSDFSQSYLPEEKVVLDCLEDVPEKPVTSHIGEPMTENKSDLLSKKIVCKQDLECAALPTKLSETSPMELSPSVRNRINVMMGRSEDKCVKALEHPQASHNETFMYKTVLWDSFQILSGISSKSLNDMDFGILHETLPEEVGRLSLNSSGSSETHFKLASNSPVHSGTFLDDVMKGEQMAPESEFSFQAIHSNYEALKKSLPKTREESYLSNPEVLERHEREVSAVAKNMQADNMLHILDSDDLLTGCAKPSLCLSLGEGKQSLSPLIKFSPVEQKLRTIVPRSVGEPCSPLELLPSLKEEEILNKSLNAEAPDSTA